ncbi:MAG TPA: NUDIX domain-containing protein [Anaerolineales bacterium]|nr:NUDIX domain-containing protein [Anaerolineales bacterium]
MNDASRIPIFGKKVASQTYFERPGAYAVIQDNYGRIATLRVETTFFLPGGGSAPDETPQATLHREIMEECGRLIQIGSELGKAIEYIYAKKQGVYYQICSTFFEAMFMDGEVVPHEEKHILVWLSASQAIQHLQRQAQVWAVRQLLRGTKSLIL